MERLKGKTAIVTGGGQGIGAAICQRLHAEGARVVVADINIAAARSVSESLPASLAQQVDVADEDQVQALVAEAIKWAGSVDIYVNNAVQFTHGDVTTASGADWDRVLGVNLKGYAFGIKHAALAMMEQAKETPKSSEADATWPFAILNIASANGVNPLPSLALYTTTKAANIMLTKNSALDLAKHKIRVNGICPGPISTEGSRKFSADLGMDPKEAFEKFLAPHMVIPRRGQPSEVAAAAAFLVSDDASFTTGTMLNVDGGYLAI